MWSAHWRPHFEAVKRLPQFAVCTEWKKQKHASWRHRERWAKGEKSSYLRMTNSCTSPREWACATWSTQNSQCNSGSSKDVWRSGEPQSMTVMEFMPSSQKSAHQFARLQQQMCWICSRWLGSAGEANEASTHNFVWRTHSRRLKLSERSVSSNVDPSFSKQVEEIDDLVVPLETPFLLPSIAMFFGKSMGRHTPKWRLKERA